MKKVLAIAAMATMIPFAAYAKSTISDSEMGKVTGQSGVSIDMDVRVDVTADTMAWGNYDGANTNWIGMKNFTIDNMTVRLRPEMLADVVLATLAQAYVDAAVADKPAAAMAFVVASKGKYTVADLAAQAALLPTYKLAVHPLTIDVATAAAAVDNKAAGTTYVRIGLGSLEIAAKNIDFTVALGQSAGKAAPTLANLSQELGDVHIGGLNVQVNGNSKVDIYSLSQKAVNAAGSGVVFDLDVKIDKLNAASMSWGNKAGTVTGPSGSAASAAATTTAGYVGYKNLAITDMTMVGPISIQVGTVNTSALGVATAATAFTTNMATIAPFAADASTKGATYAASLLATNNALFTAGGNVLDPAYVAAKAISDADAATYAAAAGAYLGNPAKAATETALSNYYYSLYNSVATAVGPSFVHIGIGTGKSESGSALVGPGGFVFGIGSMYADIAVSNNKDLLGKSAYLGDTNSAGTYGTMSMSNLKVGINGWVNIGAH